MIKSFMRFWGALFIYGGATAVVGLAIWEGKDDDQVFFMHVTDFREFLNVPANKNNLIDLFAVDIPAQAGW